MNYSPLRYPGGKSQIAPLVELIIQKLKIDNGTYIEPFAGGAGIALDLLFNSYVNHIVINDYDKAIYSVWKAILEDTNQLIGLVDKTPVSIEEWKKQKIIYSTSKKYSVELAFATLFLNRTNRSGILQAGPIGGYKQDGTWKLNARYNRDALIEKIQKIAQLKSQITVYNKDIFSFINNYIYKYEKNAFAFFDPPYYNRGKRLYKNFFEPHHHQEIAKTIFSKINCHWMVTYDDVPQILQIYNEYYIKKFDLNYSAANKGKSSEIMIFMNESDCPSAEELKEKKIKINLR